MKKIGMATCLVKPKALVVQCCVEAGYCNSDRQRSVRASPGDTAQTRAGTALGLSDMQPISLCLKVPDRFLL